MKRWRRMYIYGGKTHGKDAHLSTYDKLVKLIQESVDGCAEYWASRIADHLMENGVTIKEKQKPMAIEELKILGVYWYEERGDKLMPCEIGRFSGAHYTDINIIGWAIPDELKNNEYGKTWRCWAEKPTEEERKAAEWES